MYKVCVLSSLHLHMKLNSQGHRKLTLKQAAKIVHAPTLCPAFKIKWFQRRHNTAWKVYVLLLLLSYHCFGSVGDKRSVIVGVVLLLQPRPLVGRTIINYRLDKRALFIGLQAAQRWVLWPPQRSRPRQNNHTTLPGLISKGVRRIFHRCVLFVL